MATNNKEMDDEHTHEHCCDGHHGYMGHGGMRWILAIVILFMVFWLGMKLGEFKGFIEANYGYGFGGRANMMYISGGGPAGMMRFWQVPVDSTTNSTTTTPIPSTKK